MIARTRVPESESQPRAGLRTDRRYPHRFPDPSIAALYVGGENVERRVRTGLLERLGSSQSSQISKTVS